jgi:uncharacterized membrane protein
MKLRSYLIIIFGVSIFGVLFSGFLSYQELFAGTGIACPAPGAPGTVFGYPACVYGFFMYLFLAILSGFALAKAKK